MDHLRAPLSAYLPSRRPPGASELGVDAVTFTGTVVLKRAQCEYAAFKSFSHFRRSAKRAHVVLVRSAHPAKES